MILNSFNTSPPQVSLSPRMIPMHHCIRCRHYIDVIQYATDCPCLREYNSINGTRTHSCKHMRTHDHKDVRNHEHFNILLIPSFAICRLSSICSKDATCTFRVVNTYIIIIIGRPLLIYQGVYVNEAISTMKAVSNKFAENSIFLGSSSSSEYYENSLL